MNIKNLRNFNDASAVDTRPVNIINVLKSNNRSSIINGIRPLTPDKIHEPNKTADISRPLASIKGPHLPQGGSCCVVIESD